MQRDLLSYKLFCYCQNWIEDNIFIQQRREIWDFYLMPYFVACELWITTWSLFLWSFIAVITSGFIFFNPCEKGNKYVTMSVTWVHTEWKWFKQMQNRPGSFQFLLQQQLAYRWRLIPSFLQGQHQHSSRKRIAWNWNIIKKTLAALQVPPIFTTMMRLPQLKLTNGWDTPLYFGWSRIWKKSCTYVDNYLLLCIFQVGYSISIGDIAVGLVS